MIDTEHTDELMEELRQIEDMDKQFSEYIEKNKDISSKLSLFEYLNFHLVKLGKPLSEVVKSSGVAPSYAYNIFSGKKNKPGKYKLVPICIMLGMDLKEINRALFLADQPPLSPKSNLDAALIVCLNHGITEIEKINEFLFSHNLTSI